MSIHSRRLRAGAVVTIAATALVACGSSDSSSDTTSASTVAPATTAAGQGTTATGGTTLTPTSFTFDFAAMKTLSGVVAKGSGKIAVLLPDTTSSARYVAFDEPYFKKSFEAAGLPSSDVIIDNAGGDASTQQTQADAAITAGAKVIILDALDSGSGAAIEKNATSKGVSVIDYDRLVLGGSSGRSYVSFDNTEVGKLIGDGFEQCVSDWKVTKPEVLIMDGDPTDNNATLFANGYNSVLDPLFASKKYTKVAEPGGTWDNQTALTLFEQQYTAHPEINAVVAANDGLGGAVISALKTKGIAAKTVPVTGQDATAAGLQNVIEGYQCGSVYKPIYMETQAAAALALYARAGETAPASLLSGTTTDTTAKADVASVLLTPTWVTTKNIESTVIADQFVKVSDICTSALQAACTADGIK